MACSRELPHISGDGNSDEHTAGRLAWPNILQLKSAPSCTQGVNAGLPCGMPGMGELMDGAMQQAAQWGRQFNAALPGLVFASMPKMPHAAKHHGHAALVGSVDNLLVTHAAARLDDATGARVYHHI